MRVPRPPHRRRDGGGTRFYGFRLARATPWPPPARSAGGHDARAIIIIPNHHQQPAADSTTTVAANKWFVQQCRRSIPATDQPLHRVTGDLYCLYTIRIYHRRRVFTHVKGGMLSSVSGVYSERGVCLSPTRKLKIYYDLCNVTIYVRFVIRLEKINSFKFIYFIAVTSINIGLMIS